MADRAHSWTDWKISEIEKELDRIYSRAQKELGEKADAYFSKFGDAWKKKQAEVDAGKLSQDDFNKWFQGKVATGEHWFNMERQMAEELLHVNETATAYVNDQLPEVYSRNYNQTANGINGQISGYSFELVDASTVRRLATDDKTLLPYKYVDGKKDVRWNTQKVNSEVLQGILQGDSIPELSKRLENVVGMNKTSAVRNARTSCTSAENKGRMDMINDAEDKGVHVQKGWMATNDDRTRDSHADLNGTFVDSDELFDNGLEYPGDPNGDPAEVYNCFIGDTKIASNSEIVRSYKHEYEGQLITVKTSGGVNFTCTPNHPILTLRGWVAAESLKNGDNLIVTFGQNEFTFGIDPDVNHAFPRIDAIHKFFDKLGGKRTCALGVNFHGDVAASDVEIIAKKRLLRDGLNSSSVDSFDKFAFERTDKTLPNKRTFSKHLRRIWTTAFSFMRSRCKTLSLRFRSLRHAKVHGFRPIALLNSGRVKTLDNDVAGNIELIGKCLDGFSGMIFADNIVSIDFSSGRSHVYNLQTQNGYYFVNSIIPQSKEKSNGIFAIAKNCRCTLVYKVVAIGDNLVQYPGEEQTEEQKAEEEPVKAFDERISELQQKVEQDGLQTEYVMEAGKAVQDEISPVIDEKKRIYDEHKADVDEKYKAFRKAQDDYYSNGGSTSENAKELWDEKERLKKEWLESANNLHKYEFKDDESAQFLKNKLAEIREMGSSGLDVKDHLNNSRSPIRKCVEYAYDKYPRSWVEQSISYGDLNVKKVSRGYYSHYDSIIAISGNGSAQSNTTALHELGHRFERTVGGIRAQETEFYNRRTAGEDLEWLGSGYRYDERSRKDDFIHAYMGKDYGGSAYELVSMGFQYAYTDPIKLHEDPDMEQWIYGLLALAP